jgi:nucleotide-binding universal stress UspA family protein
VSSLASKGLGLEDIAKEVAGKNVSRGIELATAAGFAAEGRVERGKPWRVICDVAGEIDAAVIVLGARGLSRIESMVLGSVSAAVVVHAGRPVLVVPPTASPR